MWMLKYGDKVDKNFYNISLDGFDMIMEECTSNEAYNRRETIRHDIIGGTQTVMRGKYLVRDYTFKTHLLIDSNAPDVYDATFREWESKPVQVISKYMGGKFDAEVIIKKNVNDSPNYLTVEIQVIEIPKKSLIPNDVVDLPEDKVSSVKGSKKKKDKNKNNNKNNSKKKNKGSNITKTSKSKGK